MRLALLEWGQRARLALERGEIVKMGNDARGFPPYASTDYVRHETRLFTTAEHLAVRQSFHLDAAQAGRALVTARRGSDPGQT